MGFEKVFFCNFDTVNINFFQMLKLEDLCDAFNFIFSISALILLPPILDNLEFNIEFNINRIGRKDKKES